MDVSNIQPNTATPSASASPGITSDYQTFLRMLTTQMKYQDPLNPTDASDYSVQLATFSQVEQTSKTNELLTSVLSQFGVMSMSQLAGWVGQEARSSADISVTGNPITLYPEAAVGADKLSLLVRDTSGKIVSRESMPVGSSAFEWSGKGSDGKPLTPGVYQLSVESYSKDSLIASGAVEHYTKIAEVRLGDSGARLVLNGGIEVDATKITALRTAQGSPSANPL